MEQTEDKLPVVETVLENLEKIDLIRLIHEKDKTIHHLQDLSEKISNENVRVSNTYNKDMRFMSDLLTNMQHKAKEKDTAISNLLNSLNVLINIEHASVTPERGEDNND